MPTDQGRRQPSHHFGGFLGLALNRAKSKSSEHLHSESGKKLDKRVHSFRNLASGSVGFDSVLAELNHQPKFRKSQEGIELEQLQSSTSPKRCTSDTVPFSVKYSVSKQTPSKLAAMSVATLPASTQETQGTMNGDPHIMLDQSLHSIRIKLNEMRNERTNMEMRLWDLEEGLESAYHQYRIQNPDSLPLPSFPGYISVENSNDVDGYQSKSSSQISKASSPVTTSVGPPPANPQHHLHIQYRGERYMTTSKHTWQPPTPDKVSSPSPSPQMSPSSSQSSLYGATHYFLNTTPPSSPQRPQPSSTSPLSYKDFSPPASAITSTPNRGKWSLSPPRSHALSQSPVKGQSLRSLNSVFSSPQLKRGKPFRATQLSHRNSLPDDLITTTTIESATSSANDLIIKKKVSSQPAFRKRSSSSGAFERPSISPLLLKRTSMHNHSGSLESNV